MKNRIHSIEIHGVLALGLSIDLHTDCIIAYAMTSIAKLGREMTPALLRTGQVTHLPLYVVIYLKNETNGIPISFEFRTPGVADLVLHTLTSLLSH
jgi:hypothetical protein